MNLENCEVFGEHENDMLSELDIINSDNFYVILNKVTNFLFGRTFEWCDDGGEDTITNASIEEIDEVSKIFINEILENYSPLENFFGKGLDGHYTEWSFLEHLNLRKMTFFRSSKEEKVEVYCHTHERDWLEKIYSHVRYIVSFNEDAYYGKQNEVHNINKFIKISNRLKARQLRQLDDSNAVTVVERLIDLFNMREDGIEELEDITL